jgi:transcriptional regulator with XRE-family HTH domain
MVSKPHLIVINLDYARDTGALLKEIRDARNMTRSDIADALILSIQQVQGLEAGSASSFYGARLFAQALNRYADYLDHPLDRQALVQSGKWMVGAVPHDAEGGLAPQEERSAEKGFAGWNFLKKALKRLSH